MLQNFGTHISIWGFKLDSHLMMLSVSSLHSVNDGMTDKHGAGGGMRTDRGN
jgi:hypothetical protein